MTGSTGPWLALLLLAPALAFWACSLVDFTHTDEWEMRTFTRQAWLLVLTLGSVAGAVLWWAVGRPHDPRH